MTGLVATFLHKGVTCYVRRLSGGWWAGYIALPVLHPWCDRGLELERDETIDVYGGITYVGTSLVPGTFLVGFDCAHSAELIEGVEEFVRGECRKLAEQARGAEILVQ